MPRASRVCFQSAFSPSAGKTRRGPRCSLVWLSHILGCIVPRPGLFELTPPERGYLKPIPGRIYLIAFVCWTALLRASAPFPIFFQFDWHPNAQFAGLLLAEHRGWYRDAGLDVTFVGLEKGAATVDQVVSGTNWLGCAESSVLVSARAEGAPIRAIGTMLQAGPMALISLKSNGITTLNDLIGKKMGIRPEGLGALDIVLRHDGLKLEQFTIINKDQTFEQLIDGSCEAIQGYLIDEAVELETKGIPIQTIPYYEHGYPSYSQVYFTTETMLKEHRRELRKFMEVSRRGWQAALLSPDEAAQLVVNHFAPTLDPVYQRRSLMSIARLATLETGFEGIGQMSPKTWARILQTIYDKGVIQKPLEVTDIADFSVGGSSSCFRSTKLPSKEFRESGGYYPSISLCTNNENGKQSQLVDMVVAVNPEGIPATAMLLRSSKSRRIDSHIIQEVTRLWRWPTGTWRQFSIEVPIAIHQR